MKEIFKKYNNEQKTIEENRVILNNLESFIVKNPAPKQWYKNLENKILSPFSDGLLLHHKMLASSFIILLLVSVTGGTSVAAKYSIPGDTLYPVKINLNEKIQTFTAITPEEKAVVDTEHINERLKEAEKLSITNRLDDATKTQIETKFTKNLESAMIHVETLNTKGEPLKAERVKTDVENSLQKHKEIVNKLLEKNKTTKAKITQEKQVESPDINYARSAMATTFIENSTSTISSTTPKVKTKEYETKTEKNKTPLLDETLKRIMESKEENDD